MTATDREVLLAAVIASSPEDDLPRLAYADHLEESGEEARAAYVRWSLGAGPDRPMPRPHWRKWYDPWWVGATAVYTHRPWRQLRLSRVTSRGAGDPFEWLAVRRGFVEEVILPLHVWVRHGVRLATSWPLRQVRLDDAEPWNDQSVGCPFAWWPWRSPGMQEVGARATVPAYLFAALAADRRRVRHPVVDYDAHDRTGAVCFASRQDALDALSDALLLTARAPAPAPAPSA